MTDYLAPVTSRFDNVMQIKLGEAVPKRGNRYSRAFAIGLLAIFGWRITGEIPNLPKFLVVGAPHTSNWDMLVGMVGMYAIGHRKWQSANCNRRRGWSPRYCCRLILLEN